VGIVGITYICFGMCGTVKGKIMGIIFYSYVDSQSWELKVLAPGFTPFLTRRNVCRKL